MALTLTTMPACSAGVVYESGLNMFLVSTQSHGWWLAFTNPQWSLTPTASLPVKLRFDTHPPVDALASVTDSQLLPVPLADDSRSIDMLRHASELTLIAQGRSFA